MGIRTTIIQGSLEWHLARAGMVNSSESTAAFSRDRATPKDPMSFGQGAKTYVIERAAERMGGLDEDGYQSFHMLRGSALEDEALDRYEEERFATLQRKTWWVHDNMNVACSPDGFDDDHPDGRGGAEVKCLSRAKHAQVWLAQEPPPEHKYQIHINLWITGFDFWDFISYHPGVREDLQMCVIRVLPNPQFMTEISMRMIEVNRRIDKATLDLGILDWTPYWKTLGPAAIFQPGGAPIGEGSTFSPFPDPEPELSPDIEEETKRFLARLKELQLFAKKFA